MYVGSLSLHFRCLFCGRTCGSTSSANGCESPVIQPFVTSSKSLLPPREGNSQRWLLRQSDLATLSLRSSKKTSSSSSSTYEWLLFVHTWMGLTALSIVFGHVPVWVLGEGGWGTSDCGDGAFDPPSAWCTGSNPNVPSCPATVCTGQIRWLRAVSDTNLHHKKTPARPKKSLSWMQQLSGFWLHVGVVCVSLFWLCYMA